MLSGLVSVLTPTDARADSLKDCWTAPIPDWYTTGLLHDRIDTRTLTLSESSCDPRIEICDDPGKSPRGCTDCLDGLFLNSEIYTLPEAAEILLAPSLDRLIYNNSLRSIYGGN